jgi:hypothetical protein
MNSKTGRTTRCEALGFLQREVSPPDLADGRGRPEALVAVEATSSPTGEIL